MRRSLKIKIKAYKDHWAVTCPCGYSHNSANMGGAITVSTCHMYDCPQLKKIVGKRAGQRA